MKPSLIVYKASAGSGKTFTLALQYIKTLLEQESRHTYSHILAVTFTNKATAEMKDRILQQLYGIWKGLPSAQSYLTALRGELQADGVRLTDEEIRQRAGLSLCQILHDYNRFRVETIDSFFQSVLKNLAHELSLTANLKVDLNDTEVLDKAVDRLMERLHLHPTVMDWILEYVDDRIANNERWDIAREVKSFAAWIFKEAYLTHEDRLRDVLNDTARIRELRAALNTEKETAMDIVQSAAANFRDELEQRGLTLDRFKYGGNIATYLRHIEAGNLAPDFKPRMQGFVDSADNWLKKADQNDPGLREAATCLQTLLGELRQFQLDCLVRHNSASLAQKHLNPLRLLGVIDEEVTALNHENNRFLLAKTPILLHGLIEDNDAPFIFEKMGAFFHHVMIDEFQDTSTLQWRNFKVLLLESMASGFGNLIVGDVKQSIYRWRNGDWTILKNIKDEMAAHRPDIRNLDTNFRSEQRIVTFNNALFKAAAEELDRLAPDAPPRLSEAYADVAQECPPGKGERGYVQVRFFDRNDKETDWEARMLDELCDQVEALHEAGLPYREMAILVRKRKFTAPIVRHFSTRFGDRVKMVSDEAFLLSSSLSVNILISAMRYMTNPDDRVALAFLARHAGENAMPEDTGLRQLARKDLESLLPEGFTRQLDTLRTLPLYELQEELYTLFGLARIPGEDAYLFAYFDRLTDYLQDNPSDLSSFLTYWDETLSQTSIPSGEVDGIRIFTVHQSKGLQFHTVFAPYCDWDIEKDANGFTRNNDLLWCEPHQTPYDMLPVIPITAQAAMRNSIFRAEYEEEHLQRRVDSLNLLYVTFTRAEKNLFVWCRTRYALDERSTTGDLIYQALPIQLEGAEETEGENGETTRFSYGTLVTLLPTRDKKHDNRMDIRYQAENVRMHSYKAGIDFRQSNPAAEFLESMASTAEQPRHTDRKRRTGILMHRILSTIHTRNDVKKALSALETEGQIGTDEEREELRRQVETALSRPEAAHWFDGSLAVYNECPILTQEQDDQTEKYGTYRPDRVMSGPDETTVVDFKFGRADSRYREQVARYMRQIRLMEPGSRVSGYLWYITDNRLEEVQA